MNFIILVILHLIGDFYLQSDKIAKCKSARIDDDCGNCRACKQNVKYNRKYLLIHTIIYVLPFVLLFRMTDWQTASVNIGVLIISHYIIDMCTCYFNGKMKHTISFLLDQFLHILILYFLFDAFEYTTHINVNNSVIKMILTALLLMIPASVLINKLFEDVFVETAKSNIFDVGSIIGILERLLVFFFAFFNDFAAIAIIITVKTWARSKDLKKTKFRQKYLLGTLASLVVALVIFVLYKLI